MKKVFGARPFTSQAGPLSFRPWLALACLIVAYFAFGPIEDAVYRPIAHSLGLHIIVGGAMVLPTYALLMIVRLALDMLVVVAVCAILGHRLIGFPLAGPRTAFFSAIGLTTGLTVMVAAIGGIIAMGCGHVKIAPQTPALALGYGAGWLFFDYLGATGEELFGRVVVLLVAERFVGWRGALIVSGLVFAAIHIDNPGASLLWLVRLFAQGALLAYAVYRTGSVWWSIGYHTGWNWASAPLFGAIGSGYLDQGHLLEFTPNGQAWITGGAIGPEGSILAFVAVAVALVLLVMTTSISGGFRRSLVP